MNAVRLTRHCNKRRITTAQAYDPMGSHGVNRAPLLLIRCIAGGRGKLATDGQFAALGRKNEIDVSPFKSRSYVYPGGAARLRQPRLACSSVLFGVPGCSSTHNSSPDRLLDVRIRRLRPRVRCVHAVAGNVKAVLEQSHQGLTGVILESSLEYRRCAWPRDLSHGASYFLWIAQSGTVTRGPGCLPR